jgi:hypothetical protein
MEVTKASVRKYVRQQVKFLEAAIRSLPRSMRPKGVSRNWLLTTYRDVVGRTPWRRYHEAKERSMQRTTNARRRKANPTHAAETVVTTADFGF